MNDFVTKLNQEVNDSLCKFCDCSDEDVLCRARRCINLLEVTFGRLKEFTKSYRFKDEQEEIGFFREIKPKLFCHLIFYRKVYNIEMYMPKGGNEVRVSYLKKELQRITDFFNKNKDFYHYYKSGSTHMDIVYFLRGKTDITLNLESFYFERDPDFSTNCDFKVAKILANDLIESYVKKELYKLENLSLSDEEDKDNTFPKTKLTWTGKKIDLVVLAYGLKLLKCLDYGNVSLKKIVKYLGNIFNFDLGENVSRDLHDYRLRKKSNNFFDRMRDSLDDYIEELDK